MDTSNKILIEEETLDKAYKMLDKLRRHYLRKAREVEIAKRDNWEQMEAMYEAKAAEVDKVLDAINTAQGY